jgi:hypothetical protein
MNMRLCTFSSLGFLVCIVCSGLESNSALCGQKDAKEVKDSIAALFEGIPADLRSKVQENSVRRDRVNDWLSDHVNGKGKTIEIQVPAIVTATRTKDSTYTIVVSLGRAKKKGGGTVGGPFPGFGPGGPRVTVLGDEWTLSVLFAPKESAKPRSQLELAGVSPADAEKLVELDRAAIKGNVQRATIGSGSVFHLVLGDVQVEGKNMTPREPESDLSPKGAPKKGGA